MQSKRQKAIESGTYLGVRKNGNKFFAEKMFNWQMKRSSHETAIEAAKAYDKMAFEAEGINAVLNFPEDYL